MQNSYCDHRNFDSVNQPVWSMDGRIPCTTIELSKNIMKGIYKRIEMLTVEQQAVISNSKLRT